MRASVSGRCRCGPLQVTRSFALAARAASRESRIAWAVGPKPPSGVRGVLPNV